MAHPRLPDLSLARQTLDRAAHRRTDPDLLPKLLADPLTRVLPVRAGQAPVAVEDGRMHLVTVPGPEWEGPEPLAFMGEDGVGGAYLAAPIDAPVEPDVPVPGVAEGTTWAGLREAGAVLDDTGAGLLTSSVALLTWHAAHPFCAKCGARSDVTLAGWERICPVCGTHHYPRTDPAVIMSVVDAADRLLLGRQAVWPPRRWSVLAGFVEPGEPLEAAVRREVLEESGVHVGDVEYLGSQPWPFPSSLMLGYRGAALTTDLRPDGEELAEARWWTRAEVVAAMADGSLLLPGPVSIARRLIEEWFGGTLEDGVDSWR
ncbi:NAD(+) diphosphatase [Spongisporangium articulatum]|uniref:NAD(+) diphosphatase n=1 Tax=Spongisporangium articulatum TaxID=3362603 RepID=A0ABW8APM4_9ACTN